ncbi:MAG: ATP-binding protein [Saprospiraceae bacterium]|nr:ATP-binding protein [Saprospiraceae bacterium]MDW8228911.1 ATP-binding protein [Saprospiraceae bacterium]
MENKKAIFRQIIADFIDSPLPETLPRDIEIPSDVPKIISLVGPRRSGKTHLLFHLIRSLRQQVESNRLVYVNFEDDRLFPLRLDDMEAFVQAYYERYPSNKDVLVWFFFDEIQEVPHWEKFIRRLWDTERCRIYLTGSSSKLLSRELASALRGRTLPFEVLPLSFAEFLRFNQVEVAPDTSKGKATALHWFDRWLLQGGFPELVFLPESLHLRTINEYIDLMLYRDLAERFAVRQPAAMKYLLKFLMHNLANPISLNKVFQDMKSQGYAISKDTVLDYTSHLEEAFIVFRVDIWHRSVRAQAVNPSKYYTVDAALKQSTGIGQDWGRLLENAVFLHLRRQGIQPYYWREKQEVDFCWEGGIPINVCWDYSNAATQKREVQGLLAAMEALDADEGLLLTRDQADDLAVGSYKIRIRPAWTYFLGEKI